MRHKYHLQADQFLSESPLWDNVLSSGKNVVIDAPPRIGKSFAAIEILKKRKLRFVFVANTIPLAEDLGSSYGLPVFHSNSGVSTEEVQVITIPHHMSKFQNKNAVLVIDEWHSLVTDYNYKRDVIDEVLESFSSFKQVIGLTGTFNALRKGFERIEVTTNRPNIEVELISVLDPYGAVLEDIHRNPGATHWVSVLDKKYYPRKLTTLLERDGFKDEQILIYNTKTKNGPRQRDLVESNRTPAKVRIIISTYRDGISLVDGPYRFHIVSVGKIRHSPIDIAQVCQRVRTPKMLEAAFFYANVLEYHPSWGQEIDESFILRRLIGQSNQVSIDLLGARQIEIGPSAEEKVAVSLYLKKLVDTGALPEDDSLLVNDYLKPNALGILNQKGRRLTDLLYLDRVEFAARLDNLGITLTSNGKIGFIEDPARVVTVGSTKLDAKKKKERIKKALQSSALLQRHDLDMKIVFLRQYFPDSEIELILMDEDLTVRSWNRFYKKLMTLVSRDKELRRIRQRLEKTFPRGSIVDEKRLNKALKKLYRKKEHAFLIPFSTRSKAILKLFFTLKRTQNARGSNVLKVLEQKPFRYKLKTLVDGAC